MILLIFVATCDSIRAAATIAITGARAGRDTETKCPDPSRHSQSSPVDIDWKKADRLTGK